MPATADAVNPIEPYAFNTGYVLLAKSAPEMPDRVVDEVTLGECQYTFAVQAERVRPATRVSA